MADPYRLLDRHVAAFNDGVATGDWDPMVAGFAVDGELVFVGVPVGPFEGRDAIAAAYREQPPDDGIAVHDRAMVGGEIVASYSWRRGDGRKAGLLVLTLEGARIRRLVVTFEPEKVSARAERTDQPYV